MISKAHIWSWVAAAALFVPFQTRLHGAGAASINYPGTTAGLAATVTQQTTGFGLTVDSLNSGDWKISFGGIQFDQANGVVIPMAYPTYGADHIGVSGNPGRAFVEVPGRYTEIGQVAGFSNGWLGLTDISGNGTEANFDLGLVYFPFSEGWIAGSVASNGTINAGNTAKVTLAKDANDPGRFTLSITGVDSRTGGLLFTVGGDNANSGNTVATEVRADGSGWDITSYDQAGTFVDNDGDTEGDGGENGTFHFVYLPYNTPNLRGGRINDDGTTLNGNGEFTVTRSAAGTYVLKIPNGSGGFLGATDGLVIANVAKGASLPPGLAVDPDDNYLELSYSASAQGWTVRSFDLPGGGSQDTQFVFAFVPYAAALTPPAPPSPALGAADFRQFTVENHPTSSGFDVAVWEVSADGLSAAETKNSYSTFLVSPTSFIDKTIRGFIAPGSDDDLIGLALGYQPGDNSNANADYLLITWKGASQNFDYVGGGDASTAGGDCPVGLAISRVQGVPNHDEIWQRAALAGTNGGVTQIARGATLGSTPYNRSGGSHYFKIEYTSTGVRVWVDGVLQFDVDGTFVPARFCLWELSQNPGATYSQFTISELGDPDPGSVTLPALGSTPNPPATPSPANPYGLRAYVWENVDATTNRAGAGELLRRAGFHVMPFPLDQAPWTPGDLPENDVDLIFIGSYVSDSPAYVSYMAQYASVLDDFIDRGGVIVQMAQRDSVESRPVFLPATQDAARGTTNFASARVLHAANPIMANVPTTGSPATVAYALPNSETNVVFNAFESFAGFDVILSGDAIARSPALMEGSYGQGRFFLSQMTFDKIINAATDVEVAPASLKAFNTPFFANLYEHAKNVRDGTLDDLVVTPPPGETTLPDGAWSIVLLPDTQIYSQNYPGIFFSQASWIVDNIRKRNIRYVIGLGDITNINSIPEWKVARSAADIMHGNVPYILATGNHDYGPSGNASTRDTKVNEYLSYSRYAELPTFGGTKDPNNVENMYHLFEAGGVKWIIIILEWAPRDTAINWANSVLDLYPDRKAVLVTHAIVNNNNLRYNIRDTANPQDYNPHHYSTPGPVNDGEELWQKLVKRHNFVMTLNGHVLGDGTGFRVDNNDAGQPVAQMLINYQFRNLGGEGYLRILEFQPDGHTVKATSYSPIYNNFLLTADQNFTFDVPLSPPDADGDGIFDYYDDSLDSDGDGINNYLEYVLYGTDVNRRDSDGDGVNDNIEIAKGTNPLYNDRRSMGLVLDSPQSFGLYTEANIRDLSAGDLVIGREGGEFRLQFQLWGSPTLNPAAWQPVGAPVQWSTPIPDINTYFYRVKPGQ